MRWFTDTFAQLLRFAVSNGVWITAWVACLLVAALLILVLREIRQSDEQEIVNTDQLFRYVRRHTRRGGVHPVDTTAETALLVFPRSHWAITNDTWRDDEHPVTAPALGRHHADNPARTIAPADWRPRIGSERIALLETETVEVTEFRRLLVAGAV